MDPKFPRINLKPDYSISRIIKGGWQLAGGHGFIDENQAIQDMLTFVENGFTTFDCADIYTGVEQLIGKFIKKYNQEFNSGGLPPIQVHTKYVPDLDDLSSLTKANTEEIINRSLERLQVETLDLVQFHWWDYSIPSYIETAQHLVDFQKAGKIRHIGLTNFDAAHLLELINANIPVISNQVQFSVLDHRPENDMLKIAKKHNIALFCYGTLAGGFLTDRYLVKKESKEPLENRSLVKYKLIIEEFGGYIFFQELLKTLNRLAGFYNVGIAEIAIKYILQKPTVAAAIVGARNRSHLERIKKLNSFSLDENDLKNISNITSKAKGPAGPVYGLERNRTGKHGKIMKYNLNK